MARVLAHTHPGRGHLYPLVPILDELSRRGHEIRVRTLASELVLLRDLGFSAAAHGFSSAAPDERTERPREDVSLRSTLRSTLRRRIANLPGLTTFVGHYRWEKAIQGQAGRAPVEIPDMQAAIEQERPDVLLVDYTTFGAAAVAETSGLPWAQWFVTPLPVPSRDLPPFGSGLAAVATRRGGRANACRARGARPLDGTRRPATAQPRAGARGRAAGRLDRAGVHAGVVGSADDGRTARIRALGLAAIGADDRGVRLGPAGSSHRSGSSRWSVRSVVATSSESQNDERLAPPRWRRSPRSRWK